MDALISIHSSGEGNREAASRMEADGSQYAASLVHLSISGLRCAFYCSEFVLQPLVEDNANEMNPTICSRWNLLHTGLSWRKKRSSLGICVGPLATGVSAVSVSRQQLGSLEWVGVSTHLFEITLKLQFYWCTSMIVFRDVLP